MEQKFSNRVCAAIIVSLVVAVAAWAAIFFFAGIL